MTQTPDEVLLAPNGGLPTANYPGAELVKFLCATPAREAAEDMLAALEMAQLWLNVDGRFDMQGINAAISKAKGETN